MTHWLHQLAMVGVDKYLIVHPKFRQTILKNLWKMKYVLEQELTKVPSSSLDNLQKSERSEILHTLPLRPPWAWMVSFRCNIGAMYGLDWLMIKWLTLKSSLSFCKGSSVSKLALHPCLVAAVICTSQTCPVQNNFHLLHMWRDPQLWLESCAVFDKTF